nr:uncharacterized protein LOC112729586 [Arachis hypogaea]
MGERNDEPKEKAVDENPDPKKAPSIFVLVDEAEEYSDPEPGLHCYESKELQSCADSDEEQSEVFPQGNADAPVGQVRLEVGMEFESLEQFKRAVRKFNINLGRSIFFPRVDSTRVKVLCWDENCPWQIYFAKRNYPLSYQVKTFVNEHTCCRVVHNRSANGKWVVDELEQQIRVQPMMTVREAEDYFKKEYDVLLSERKIYRSMAKAKERIEGSERAQYARLREYAMEILNTNPGSTVNICTTPMPNSTVLFRRIYICLDACRKGFLAGCRPFINLDVTFLRGYYGGQLLTAVSQDANNHIYPITYAIVDSETKDNWKWFLQLLQEDLGDQRNNDWTFMSDQQKGLIPALEDVTSRV